MSSYGAAERTQQPQLPAPAPRRRRKLLIGLGVVLAVLAVVGGVWFTQRGDGGKDEGRPSPGGSAASPGQAKALSAALTAKGLECSVRLSVAAGGYAGCFGWADLGMTSTQVLFQYQADGTVTGVNVNIQSPKHGVDLKLLASRVQTVGAVVFGADQTAVAQAVSGLETVMDKTFDGAWGKYQVHYGAGGSTVTAARSGAGPLAVPRLEMTTTPPQLANGLAAKGMRCHPSGEACDGTFRAGKGRTSMLASGLGSGGIMIIAIGADDPSSDPDEKATNQAFTELLGTTFGIIRGSGLADVQKWVAAHRDAQSHSAYVGGWQVDLVVKYPAPSQASGYRLTIRGDAHWAVPH